MRDTIMATGRACIVDVAAIGQLPLPMVGVLATIDSELQRAGNHLTLAQPDASWTEPLRFLTGEQRKTACGETTPMNEREPLT